MVDGTTSTSTAALDPTQPRGSGEARPYSDSPSSHRPRALRLRSAALRQGSAPLRLRAPSYKNPKTINPTQATTTLTQGARVIVIRPLPTSDDVRSAPTEPTTNRIIPRQAPRDSCDDTPAATALLESLFHHAHVIAIGAPSRRQHEHRHNTHMTLPSNGWPTKPRSRRCAPCASAYSGWPATPREVAYS